MTVESQLITLGIETSCDETGVAVYRHGIGVLSNVLFSQVALHQSFGGVIPEIASRSQLERIAPLVEQAIAQAQLTLSDIDGIAVTHKPGLAGSLLVGVCFAKAIAWVLQKPLIGVNHLEGHVFSACIENEIPFPFLCLTASGGHTALYLVHNFGEFAVLGATSDDAAGEAFDKVAKMIGLGYPGGPVIEQLARTVDFVDFFHYPRSNKKTLNFSFSGLKTAVLYDLVKRKAYDLATKTFLKPDDSMLQKQVASSLLNCIADIFVTKIVSALEQYRQLKAIAFVGGVACNQFIRHKLADVACKKGVPLFFPSPKYCTDNGAMIAFVGSYKAQKKEFSDLSLDILV